MFRYYEYEKAMWDLTISLLPESPVNEYDFDNDLPDAPKGKLNRTNLCGSHFVNYKDTKAGKYF